MGCIEEKGICKSGNDEKSFAETVKKIDGLTRQEILGSEDTDFYIKVDKMARVHDAGKTFRKFNKDILCFGNGELGELTSMNLINVNENERLKYFMDFVYNTGLMAVREEYDRTVLYAFTETAIRTMCGKFSMYSDSVEGNSYARNYHLVCLLFEDSGCKKLSAKDNRKGVPLDGLRFITRSAAFREPNGLSLRIVCGVTSGKFHEDNISAMYDLYRKMKEDNSLRCAPKILDWNFNGDKMEIKILFPEKSRTYQWTDKQNVTITPGVRFIDSDCGRSSFTMQAFMEIEGCIYYYMTKRKRHDGKIDPVKEGMEWVRSMLDSGCSSFFKDLEDKQSRSTDTRKENARAWIKENLRAEGKDLYKEIGKKRWKKFEGEAVRKLEAKERCSVLDIQICIMTACGIIGSTEKISAKKAV